MLKAKQSITEQSKQRTSVLNRPDQNRNRTETEQNRSILVGDKPVSIEEKESLDHGHDRHIVPIHYAARYHLHHLCIFVLWANLSEPNTAVAVQVSVKQA